MALIYLYGSSAFVAEEESNCVESQLERLKARQDREERTN
jgi:hypothetical protein